MAIAFRRGCMRACAHLEAVLGGDSFPLVSHSRARPRGVAICAQTAVNTFDVLQNSACSCLSEADSAIARCSAVNSPCAAASKEFSPGPALALGCPSLSLLPGSGTLAVAASGIIT